MRVNRVDFLARRVAHQRLADFLQDTGLHQARVKRVAEVVKTQVADASALDGTFPGGLDLHDRTFLEGKNNPSRLAPVTEQVEKPAAYRDLATFTAARFRFRNTDELPAEIDVFPALRQDLAPAHAGIKRRDDDVAQVRCCCRQQFLLLRKAENEARLAARPDHGNMRQRVAGEKALFDAPKQNATQGFQVTIDGDIRQGLLVGMSLLAIFTRLRLCDPADWNLSPKRQQ